MRGDFRELGTEVNTATQHSIIPSPDAATALPVGSMENRYL